MNKEPLSESYLHFFVSALKSVERVKGIEPSCLLPDRIHQEILQIMPENQAKRR